MVQLISSIMGGDVIKIARLLVNLDCKNTFAPLETH